MIYELKTFPLDIRGRNDAQLRGKRGGEGSKYGFSAKIFTLVHKWTLREGFNQTPQGFHKLFSYYEEVFTDHELHETYT